MALRSPQLLMLTKRCSRPLGQAPAVGKRWNRAEDTKISLLKKLGFGPPSPDSSMPLTARMKMYTAQKMIDNNSLKLN